MAQGDRVLKRLILDVMVSRLEINYNMNFQYECLNSKTGVLMNGLDCHKLIICHPCE